MENTTNEELDLSYCINLVFKRFWLLVAMVAFGSAGKSADAPGL